jgi:hypothetical protein
LLNIESKVKEGEIEQMARTLEIPVIKKVTFEYVGDDKQSEMIIRTLIKDYMESSRVHNDERLQSVG